jgi:hypothetical protein
MMLATTRVQAKKCLIKTSGKVIYQDYLQNLLMNNLFYIYRRLFVFSKGAH